MKLFKDEKTNYFALGILVATAGVKFLKSETFHKGCVNVVAEGMKIRSAASAKAAKIREDAEDKAFDSDHIEVAAEKED